MNVSAPDERLKLLRLFLPPGLILCYLFPPSQVSRRSVSKHSGLSPAGSGGEPGGRAKKSSESRPQHVAY